MELRHLRYFVTAAEEENFNRASERLHVSQPALSRRIHDLEVELGVTLFDRLQKRVTLSHVGRAFYEDVKRMLDDLESSKQHIRSLARGELGTLTLGINDSVIRHKIVSSAFQKFSLRYPDVDLRLDPMIATSLVEAVLGGSVDAVFMFSRPNDTPTLDFIEIANDDFVVALPQVHPLAAKREIRLADLQGERFIWLRREVAPSLHDRLISACQSCGLTPRIVQYVSSEATRLQLVSAGMGFTFVTASMDNNTLPDNVVIKPVVDLSVPIKLDLAWRQDRISPILERFIAVVSDLTRPTLPQALPSARKLQGK